MSLRTTPLRFLTTHVVDKKRVDFGVSVGRRQGKRRGTYSCFDVSCTPTVEQELTRLGVTFGSGKMKRRLLTFISGILVAPCTEQELASLGVAYEGGKMKRRYIILSPGILTPSTGQDLTRLGVAFEGGKMKRCHIILISGILLAPSSEQYLAGLGTAFEGGKMKRRQITLSSGFLLTPTIKQDLASFDVVLVGCADCKVKRGVRVPPKHTSIEVQTTDTHVSGLHRTTESFTIEVTTLLPQSVGSARCRCRRQLDNAAALERKHAFVVQRTPADLQAHLLDIQRRQRGLQGRLERCQRSAVGVHLHRHFRTPERCRDVHSCVVVCPLSRKRCDTEQQGCNDPSAKNGYVGS